MLAYWYFGGAAYIWFNLFVFGAVGLASDYDDDMERRFAARNKWK